MLYMEQFSTSLYFVCVCNKRGFWSMAAPSILCLYGGGQYISRPSIFPFSQKTDGIHGIAVLKWNSGLKKWCLIDAICYSLEVNGDTKPFILELSSWINGSSVHVFYAAGSTILIWKFDDVRIIVVDKNTLLISPMLHQERSDVGICQKQPSKTFHYNPQDCLCLCIRTHSTLCLHRVALHV